MLGPTPTLIQSTWEWKHAYLYVDYMYGAVLGCKLQQTNN